MKHPTLFEIPRQPAVKSKESIITEFCKVHGIWTNRAKGCDDPWIAMAWKDLADYFETKCDGSDNACFELFAKYCGWAADNGFLVEGRGRQSCVVELARRRGLPSPFAERKEAAQ